LEIYVFVKINTPNTKIKHTRIVDQLSEFVFFNAARVANAPGVQEGLELPDPEHQSGVNLLVGRQSLQMPVKQKHGVRGHRTKQWKGVVFTK